MYIFSCFLLLYINVCTCQHMHLGNFSTTVLHTKDYPVNIHDVEIYSQQLVLFCVLLIWELHQLQYSLTMIMFCFGI